MQGDVHAVKNVYSVCYVQGILSGSDAASMSHHHHNVKETPCLLGLIF